jgi:hypothetical protein
MLARTSETIVEVACAGCGRIQRVPASKLIDCDGYICSYTGCATNPEFRLPEPPRAGSAPSRCMPPGRSPAGQSAAPHRPSNAQSGAPRRSARRGSAS